MTTWIQRAALVALTAACAVLGVCAVASRRPRRPKQIRWPDGRLSAVRWRQRPRSEGDECWAHVDLSTGTITISSGLAEPSAAHYLLHELCHVAAPELDEKAVLRVTGVLCGVLLCNPQLLAWLAEVFPERAEDRAVVSALGALHRSGSRSRGRTRRGAGRAT